MSQQPTELAIGNYGASWDQYGADEWSDAMVASMKLGGVDNLFSVSGSEIAFWQEAVAKVRESGGIPDDQALGDAEGAMKYLRSLPYVNGKVGVFGTCSGGRLTFLTACRVKGFDAAVECWGGRVVASGDDLTANQPVAPFDYTKDLGCPLLGLFGNEDQSPTPEQVDLHEEELKKHGKNYEFHRYDKAGHGFMYYDRAMYRQEQAVDGWSKVFAFLDKNLL